MSYITHVTGEFTITPPLPWREFQDSRFAPDNAKSNRDPDLLLRVEEVAVDTVDGQLIRKTAVALEMREIDEYNSRNLLAQVQEAVDAFPDHEFTGRLDCAGEENADLWRVVVRDGRAVKVVPEIVWPDDAA